MPGPERDIGNVDEGVLLANRVRFTAKADFQLLAVFLFPGSIVAVGLISRLFADNDSPALDFFDVLVPFGMTMLWMMTRSLDNIWASAARTERRWRRR